MRSMFKAQCTVCWTADHSSNCTSRRDPHVRKTLAAEAACWKDAPRGGICILGCVDTNSPIVLSSVKAVVRPPPRVATSIVALEYNAYLCPGCN